MQFPITMKKLIIALLFLGALAFAPRAEAAFSFSRTLTIDHFKVASSSATSTYVDFPVLVSVTTTTLKTTGNGGNVQNDNGFDIVFSTSTTDCSSNQGNGEIERYSSSTGELLAWVRMSGIATSTDSVFYMCYGDAAISVAQGASSSVWNSNYKAVYHLPNGTTLTAIDSTSNKSNGALTNAPTATSSQIGGGAFFSNADTQSIQITDNSGLGAMATSSDWTMEVWNKHINHAGFYPFIQIGSNANFIGIENANKYSIVTNDTLRGTFGTADTAAFHHLAAVKNSSTYAFYLDGVAVSNGGGSDSGYGISGTALMDDGFTGVNGNGYLDEARISGVVRTADWIKTGYNNQSSPATFMTLGAETSLGGGGATFSHKMLLAGSAVFAGRCVFQ